MSLPSRERGLKCVDMFDDDKIKIVAPLAGAWIEILVKELDKLKIFVAPLAGAWIEIQRKNLKKSEKSCRSPRGSVD